MAQPLKPGWPVIASCGIPVAAELPVSGAESKQIPPPLARFKASDQALAEPLDGERRSMKSVCRLLVRTVGLGKLQSGSGPLRHRHPRCRFSRSGTDRTTVSCRRFDSGCAGSVGFCWSRIRRQELPVNRSILPGLAAAVGLVLFARTAALSSAQTPPVTGAAAPALSPPILSSGAALSPAEAAPPDEAAPPQAPNRLPPPLAAKLAAVPDLTQTDPELELPGGGNSYCGPVAVSNSLMWLAHAGCGRLLPPGDDPKAQQLELVRRLSSRRFMSTSPIGGTGAPGILKGLARYLAHAGCQYRSLKYQGWRGHPKRFSTGVRTPQLEWIRAGIQGGGAAWINAGWYRRTRYHDAYRRRGGHWLTVVGVGTNEQGQDDPAVLIVHDPAPYAGTGFANEFIRIKLIESGWLLDGKLSLPAGGYYQLTGGMHVKREGELAIMDAAVVLRVE